MSTSHSRDAAPGSDACSTISRFSAAKRRFRSCRINTSGASINSLSSQDRPKCQRGRSNAYSGLDLGLEQGFERVQVLAVALGGLCGEPGELRRDGGKRGGFDAACSRSRIFCMRLWQRSWLVIRLP